MSTTSSEPPPGATQVERGADGTLLGFVPVADVVIDGVPCRAGAPVRLVPGGRVVAATLAAPWTARIGGRLFGKRVTCVAGSPLERDAAGTPVAFTPDAPIRLGGVVLAAGEPVRFGAGPTLEGVLAEPATRLGVRLPAGTRIREEGDLLTVELGAPLAVAGAVHPAGTRLQAHAVPFGAPRWSVSTEG